MNVFSFSIKEDTAEKGEREAIFKASIFSIAL